MGKIVNSGKKNTICAIKLEKLVVAIGAGRGRWRSTAWSIEGRTNCGVIIIGTSTWTGIKVDRQIEKQERDEDSFYHPNIYKCIKLNQLKISKLPIIFYFNSKNQTQKIKYLATYIKM